MDLETAKLVAFALLMETGDGVTGKGPEYVATEFNTVQGKTSIEEVREYLGEAWGFLLDNYLTVWGIAEEPGAPIPEGETVEITGEGEKVLEKEEKAPPKKGKRGG